MEVISHSRLLRLTVLEHSSQISFLHVQAQQYLIVDASSVALKIEQWVEGSFQLFPLLYFFYQPWKVGPHLCLVKLT